MPRPVASRLCLTKAVRQQLEDLVRARSTPQALAFRCPLFLAAAADAHPTNQQVADQWDYDRHTVGQWRKRFATHGLAGLQDAPAPADRGAFSPDVRLQVVNLATRQTEDHGQPATRWCLADLAAAIVNEAHAASADGIPALL